MCVQLICILVVFVYLYTTACFNLAFVLQDINTRFIHKVKVVEVCYVVFNKLCTRTKSKTAFRSSPMESRQYRRTLTVDING